MTEAAEPSVRATATPRRARRRLGLRCLAVAAAFACLMGFASPSIAAPLAETDAFVVGGEPKDLVVDEVRGRLFVSDLTGDSVAVVDLASGLVTRRLPAPGGPVGLALTPDGRTLFAAGYFGGTLLRIDVETGRVEATLGSLGDPWDVALVDSGGRTLVALTEHHADQVTFVDPQSLARVASVPTDYYPYQLTVDPDARRLYVASYGGRDGGEVAAIDLDSLGLLWARSAGQGSFDVVVDAARGLVVVSDFTGRSLSRFDVDGRILATQALTGGPKSLLLSPEDGTLYAAIQTEDRVRAYETQPWTERSATVTGSRPGALAWWEGAPEGRALLVADQGDGTVSVLTDGAAPPAFADVPVTHPEYRAIRVLAARGALSGFDATGGSVPFKPDGTLMRAQLAKILVGSLGLHTDAVEQGGVAFTDVPVQRDEGGALVPYPYDYVQEANRAGIVTGFPGQPPRFKPYEPVTRIQLLRMAVRAAAAVGSPLPEPEGPSPFTDISAANPDRRVALQAYEAGLIDPVIGTDGRARLHPYDRATRAVTAHAVFALLGALHREEAE